MKSKTTELKLIWKQGAKEKFLTNRSNTLRCFAFLMKWAHFNAAMCHPLTPQRLYLLIVVTKRNWEQKILQSETIFIGADSVNWHILKFFSKLEHGESSWHAEVTRYQENSSDWVNLQQQQRQQHSSKNSSSFQLLAKTTWNLVACQHICLFPRFPL
jgi:hypothetical protein